MASLTKGTGFTIAYACPCNVKFRLSMNSLDRAEHSRAARMSNKTRHDHFIAGRALLRHLLSTATGNAIQPATWQFEIAACGKPSVAPGLPQLHFSISHAHGLIAVAISPVAEIGIDLERVTGTRGTSPALDQLTHDEQAWLNQHSEAERWPAFLQLWTAKEAVSKATGLGCGLDFDAIEIDVPAGRAQCPDGLLDVGDHMDVDLRNIKTSDATYCLSVACMQTDAGKQSVS